MIPVDFEGANGQVPGRTHAPCRIAIDSKGQDYILIGWQPNVDDLEAIKNGGLIWMKIESHRAPGIGLFTTNQQGEINQAL